jgi:hypothetical protein
MMPFATWSWCEMTSDATTDSTGEGATTYLSPWTIRLVRERISQAGLQQGYYNAAKVVYCDAT